MESALGVPDGSVTEDHIQLYTTAARGGVGLMMLEGIGVHPAGKFYDTQITAYDDDCIPGLKLLADSIHAHGDGVVAWVQLHCGGAAHFGYSYGQKDNSIDLNVFGEEMIDSIIEGYANAALRVKKGGFDGVEIHGGHGYLVAQFLSPAVNNRTDRWGKTAEDRMRFPLEIYRRIREKCGEDFPLGIKMNTADLLPGGNFLDETVKIARAFALIGYDLIEMSGGMGMMIELREALRKQLGNNEYYFKEAIPAFVQAVAGTKTALCVTGGIGSPEVMEELLQDGVDFVGMARPWLCEPDLANRIRRGDRRPVRCVSREQLCNLCLTRLGLGPVTCYKFYQGYCKMQCPVDQDTPDYIGEIALGNFAEAARIIRKENPLPNTLCRICDHKCEWLCKGQTGEPLAIRDLKRFAMDYAKKHDLYQEARIKTIRSGEKVAVVGSGPAGLSCAHALAVRGHSPTVFEKNDVVGGVPRTAIPAFRLPREAVEDDIRYIRSAGVEFKTGVEYGRDITIESLFDEGYKAVFLGIGATLPVTLDVPGNSLAGISAALDFLEAVNRGRDVAVGKRVAVIGGGSVAMDAAMTALRVGATEVHVVCLESPENMPASKEELEDALAEGVVLHNSLGVEAFEGDGKSVNGIRLIACTSVFDQEGRFCPVYDRGVSESLRVDNVIVAIGQKPDMGCLCSPAAGEIARKGRIAADANTLATAYAGVFAGGDAVSGPGTVVEAARSGKEAAESIDRYLRNLPLARVPKDESYKPFFKGCSGCEDPEKAIKKEKSLRAVPGKLDAAVRVNGFAEITGALTEEEAVREAKRCLKYDLDLAEKSAARLKNAGPAAFDFKRVTGKEW